MSEKDLKRVLLYRAFTRAVFLDIQKEIKSQIKGSLFTRMKEAITERRSEVIEQLDELLEGACEAEITDVTAASTTSVNSSDQSKISFKDIKGTNLKAGASAEQ